MNKQYNLANTLNKNESEFVTGKMNYNEHNHVLNISDSNKKNIQKPSDTDCITSINNNEKVLYNNNFSFKNINNYNNKCLNNNNNETIKQNNLDIENIDCNIKDDLKNNKKIILDDNNKSSNHINIDNKAILDKSTTKNQTISNEYKYNKKNNKVKCKCIIV